MVTVFQLDRDPLMLTHVDGPATRTSASPDQLLEFVTFDVANLGHTFDGHMQAMSIRFSSPDEIVQTWVWREKNKDLPAVFRLKRQSPSNLP